MFADVVGYTTISERLGEERIVAFVRAIYDVMASAVHEHGGAVRGFAGDSIMGVFGIPDVLEDAALRACRAAAAIHAAVAKAADDIEARFDVRPVMRAGVSSGMTVMAAVEGEGAALTAIGDTVNLASRLQSLASPGGTVICETTQRLVKWLADTSFEGEHAIKGKSKAQKVWRLDAVREQATRFDASVGRGLSRFVGRDGELATMQDALRRARDGFQAIDLVAEPGLGKTRLVFEFLRTIGADDVLVLTGQCAADGRNTPFLPFLGVVRRAFGIQPQDDQADTATKLDAGLRALDMHTAENLGLLTNLLGLQPAEGALAGLDGVLIGLRTRDLLAAMLKAQCRVLTVVLLLEDIHWLDSTSEEILNALIAGHEPPNLLVIATRRPEYAPRWHGDVTTIALKPLNPDDIGRLLLSRLGVTSLPDALARQVTERAAGNPLFGEEILSYLLDQGAVRVASGKADFDGATGPNELPTSIQGLLATRTDRLPLEDRALLQAAASIGRQFDPALLSLVAERPDAVDAALQRLQAQDIVHRADGSEDYVFKHVLLRDSVYQSLLSERRGELHLKIAKALERRSEGRLTEAADTLAYHYALTDRNDSTFRYLAMAAVKSLGVFSLDEADQYFAAAVALYERDRNCATDAQLVSMLAKYALSSNIGLRVKRMSELATKFTPQLNRAGDSHEHVLFLHHYVASLVWSARFEDASQAQRALSAMAERLGDPQSAAYAMVSEMSVATYRDPTPIEIFEARRRQTEAALATVDDAHIHNFYCAVLAWDQMNRGRVTEARAANQRLMDVGVVMNDPRSLGYAASMNALLAIVSDNYEEGLVEADRGISIARAPFEMISATTARNSALVMLNKPGAIGEVERYMALCRDNGWALFLAGPDSLLGIALALNGRIGEGLRHIEGSITRREAEGYRAAADWARMFLCEAYLDIISGKGKVSFAVIARNIRTLIWVSLFGPKRIASLIAEVRANPQYDPDGYYMGRAEMILGLLYQVKKKTALAAGHLAEARRILGAFGPSPTLARVEAGWAALNKGTG